MNDKKTHETLDRLENSVQFIHVKSTTSQMCHLSISINAGRYYETTQPLGFTHLAEHLLFTLHPNHSNAGSLQKLIDENGGVIDAWTNATSINVHLSIPTCHVKRLMPVIIDSVFFPAITAQHVRAEIQAIDAEFTLNQHNDSKRLLSIQKALAPKCHPFSRFSVGNEQTLSSWNDDELVGALQAFYSKHFCGKNVVFGLSSPALLPKDILQSVRREINRIPPGKRQSFPVRPTLQFNSGQAFICKVRPILPSESLIQSFLVPINSKNDVDNKAMSLLQQFVLSGHSGGLVSKLRHHFQLEHMVFANGIQDADVEELQIRMTFSQKLKYHDVISISCLIRSALQQLQTSLLKPWQLREKECEQDILNYLSNDHFEQTELVELVEEIQHGADLTSMNEGCLLSDRVTHRYYDILKKLTSLPHNTIWFSQHDNVKQLTDYYHTQYDVLPFSESSIKGHDNKKSIHIDTLFPPKNRYISHHPRKVDNVTTDTIRSFTKPNCRFVSLRYINDNRAIGDIYFSLGMTAMSKNHHHKLVKRVWLEHAQAYVKEKYQNANAAGLFVRVYGHQSGICVHTSGLCEKQLILVLDVVNDIQQLTLDESQFVWARKRLIKSLHKKLLQKPLNRLVGKLGNVKSHTTLEPQELIALAQRLTYAQFARVQHTFFTRATLETLLVGAWDANVPKTLWRCVKNRDFLQHNESLALLPSTHLSSQRQLRVDTVPHEDSAAVLYYELTHPSAHQYVGNSKGLTITDFNVVLTRIIDILLSPLLFVEMRNIRQLGYAVGVGYKLINQTPGLMVYAQTPKYEPTLLCAEMAESLRTVVQTNITLEGHIERAKQQLHQQLMNTPNDCTTLGRHLWAIYDKPNALEYNTLLANLVHALDSEVVYDTLYRMIDGDITPCIVQTQTRKDVDTVAA